MYDRERVARGAGTAIAIWVLIALTFLSTGVTYAVPLAGIGGFNVTVGVVESDGMALYPAVGDTSERDAYPQAIVELRNTELKDLYAYKDLDVSGFPVLSGTARFRLASQGHIDSGNVLLKTSALSADDAIFRGFSIEDEGTGDIRTSYELFANESARLEDVEMRAHYLTTSSIDLSELSLAVCYDADDDGVWERGPCDGSSTFVTNNNAPYADATVTDHIPEPGTMITFDGSSSADSDGSIQSYQWDFGDGTTATGQSVSHAYSTEGTYTATLTVTDDRGATDTAYLDVTVDTNQVVTASASANQTTANPGELVVFDGFASTDEDGYIESYEWDFGDGTTTTTGDLVNHTYASTGNYTVTFTATDDDGESASDTVSLSIEQNQPPSPSISANRSSAKIDESIRFDASGSTDSDGRIVAYQWDFGDNTTATGVNATHNYSAQGNYTVTLTTRDNDGATATATLDVSISPNDPPTASATANLTSVNPTDAVAFDGSGSSDPDGSITSYAWDFGDNTTATGANVTHSYSSTGTYNATLTVTDDNGATSTDTVQITVALNAAPTVSASANRTSVTVDEAIAFDASNSTDVDGSITSYEWAFGDNTTATGATATHAYSADGTYNATVTVTDDDGATSTETIEITVAANTAPSASASANDTSANPGDVISFDGSGSSDSDGSISSYDWAFGDNATATGQTVTHDYNSTGTYDATLTVTDDDGATGTDTIQITVSTNAAPTANVTANRTTVNTSDAISFDATGSSDPDGSISSYEWTFGDNATATGATVTHSYGSTGTYTVEVNVTDDDGATDTATVTITVN